MNEAMTMPNDGTQDFGEKPSDAAAELVQACRRTKAALDRIAELEARVATLRGLCAEVYQVVGALSTLLPGEHEPTTRVLDNLSAAASDEPLPHAELLPYVLPGRETQQS